MSFYLITSLIELYIVWSRWMPICTVIAKTSLGREVRNELALVLNGFQYFPAQYLKSNERLLASW